MPRFNCFFTLIAALLLTPFLGSTQAPLGEEMPVYNRLEFIPNQGQYHPNVRFKLGMGANEVFLEQNQITYHSMDLSFAEHHAHDERARPDSIARHAVKLEFLGANPEVKLKGTERGDHYFNFFLGKDRSKWAPEVHPVGKVEYKDLYPNTDLIFYENGGQAKYDFVLEAGADPSLIRMQYRGQDELKLKGGNLFIKTSLGNVQEQAPFAYQEIGGEKLRVDCKFKLEGNVLSFDLGKYDESKVLVIDPTLIFSTYSGSTAANFGYTATFDSEGFLYSGSTVFGLTGTYPTDTGAFQTSFGGGTGTSAPPFGLGGTDVAITKWDTTGSSFVYSTYLGGNEDELPHSLVVNSRDELYILGTTGSSNFPVDSLGYDTSFAGGPSYTPAGGGIGIRYGNGCDIFVSKLSTQGSTLLGSTYLGGTGNDGINNSLGLVFNYADEVRGEIDVDQFDNIMIASSTASTNFPMVGSPFQNTNRGNQEGIVVKLTNGLNGIVWSTYLGGNFDDAVYSLAIRSNNDIVVTGGTVSSNFPNNTNANFPSYQGGRSDGFVTHIRADGRQMIRSTYYGTGAYDQSYFVETDKDDNVYLFGQTQENWNALIQNATYNTPGSGQFVSKLNSTMDTTIWSTRFGTSTPSTSPANINISPTAFLVDLCNAIYLSGWGGTTNGSTVNGMDTTTDAFQGTTDGSDFYLMVIADDASSLKYGSFFGGTASEHVDGGTSRFDRKGKVYQAVCAGCPRLGSPIHDFPTSQTAYSDSNLAANPPSCNLAVFKMDFNLPIVVADFQVALYHCLGDTVFFNNNSLEQSQTNFQWFFDDGTTSGQRDPFHIYTSPGDYFVRLVVSDTGTCNLADSITKLVRIVADTSIQFAPLHMCYGDSLQIGFQPLYFNTYNWSPGIYTTDSTIARPYATAPDTTDYILLMDNGVCVDTVRQTVFVDSSVTAIFTAPALFCLRDSLDVANSSSPYLFTSYEWDFGNGDTSLQKDPFYTYTSPGTFNVRLIALDPLSCNLSDTSIQQVVVLQDSVYNLPSITFCPGDTFQIGIPPISFQPYLWLPGTYLSDSTISNPIAYPDTTTEYVLLRDNGACYDSIFVELVQDSAVLSSFNSLTEICAPFNLQFTNTSQFLQNSQFFWDFGNGDTSQALNPAKTYTTRGTYAVKLVVFDAASCNGIDSVSININVDEDSTYAVDTVVLCNGLSEEIGLPSNPSYTYIWNTSFGITDSNISNPVATITQYQLYELLVDRGACVDTVYQPVDVDSIFVLRDADTLVCSDAAGIGMELRTKGTGVRFHWASHPSFIDTLNANKTDSFATVIPFDAENTYYIKTWSEKGCEENDTIVLNVGDLGVEVSRDSFICFNDSINLEALTTIANDTLSFLWGPGNEIFGPLDSNTVLVNPLEDIVFYVHTINSIGCERDDSILVEVSDLMPTSLTAESDKDTILITESAQLVVLPLGYNYVWRPGIALSDSTSSTPVASPGGTILYEVDVIDPENEDCFFTDSVLIVVRELNCGLPDVFVPNAFTPDGDGNNEKLFVYGRFIKELYFAVYNRWGEKVFETTDQDIGWDGTFKGVQAQIGVYDWYLNVVCEDEQRLQLKGNTTLIQ